MKKIIAIFLAILVLCSFASCNDNTEVEEESKNPFESGKPIELPPMPIDPIN